MAISFNQRLEYSSILEGIEKIERKRVSNHYLFGIIYRDYTDAKILDEAVDGRLLKRIKDSEIDKEVLQKYLEQIRPYAKKEEKFLESFKDKSYGENIFMKIGRVAKMGFSKEWKQIVQSADKIKKETLKELVNSAK